MAEETQEVRTDELDDAALDKQLEGGETVPEQDGQEQPTESKDEPKVDPIEEKIAKLEKRLNDKESMIQRQANELGELRRLKREAELAAHREKIKEQFFEDPIAGARAVAALDAAEMEGKREEVLAVIPDFEDLVDTMVEVAREDGEPESAIRAFKANPFHPPVSFLSQYAKRAKAKSEAKAKESEAERLKAELEASKRKTKDTLDRVARHAEAAPAVTAGSGGSTRSTREASLTEESIAEMSDADLERMLSEAK